MKLVITINNDIYDDYLKQGATVPKYGTAIGKLYEALWNGVPLPEHHGRLIDEQDISPLYHCMSHIYCEHRDCNTCQFCCITKYEVTDTPTIIEAEGSESE